jgi:hypothetical protein
MNESVCPYCEHGMVLHRGDYCLECEADCSRLHEKPKLL